MPNYEFIVLSFGAGVIVAIAISSWLRSHETSQPDPQTQLDQHLELFSGAARAIAHYTGQMTDAEDQDLYAMLQHATLADLTAIATAVSASRENIAKLDELYTGRIVACSQDIGLTEALRRVRQDTAKREKAHA